MARPDEHYPCASDDCPDKPWHAMFNALVRAAEEEAESLRRLVDDPDSLCPARPLREQRLRGLEWVLGVAGELERWEW